MSDDQPKDGIRRVGKDNRKRELERRDLRFPPERPPTLPPAAQEDDDTDTAPVAPLPRLKDAEADIPTDRTPAAPVPTPSTAPTAPPQERFPPIPQRDLPPEIERSPNLYPDKQPAPKPERRKGAWLARLVIALIVLAIGGAVAYVAYIIQNPYSQLNPLVPPTPFPRFITATFLPPTETQTATPEGTPTPLGMVAAPVDGATVAFDFGATALPATDAPTLAASPPGLAGERVLDVTPLGDAPTATVTASVYPFVRETGLDFYAPNGNERGCEWSSIAGWAFDLNGEPIDGLGVQITDQMTGETSTVYTGSSATFSDGGFELPLGSVPQVNGYFVQLLSPAQAPLSESITVVTSDKCNQNVALVSFKQIAPY